MRITAILLFVFFLVTGNVSGQTRTINGKVIDDQLRPIIGARINNADTTLLTTSDNNGNFSLDIPANTKSLIVNGIGFEWKLLDLTNECSYLEIIMLNSGSYDFMSARKVDRLRKKYFDTLPKLHQAAYDKGVFKVTKPCYEDKFISERQRLKEIHRARTQMPST